MKILFTADLHIKLGQKNVPRKWQRNRYRLLFKEIHKLEEKADLLILGGDIFDRLPTIEELEHYFLLIKDIKIPTIIYPGNHEMTTKKKSFLSNLKDVSLSINSNIEIITESCNRYGLDIIPYNDIKTFIPKNFSSDILCTHVRGAILPHVKPEIDLKKLNRWKIVLAGDLHAYSNSQRNILYPGSPLSTSFHRKPITNGVILFDTETKVHRWVDLKLPQLIRKTVQSEKEMIKTSYDHTIYELEGDIQALAKVNIDNDLLDKKIINKNTEAKINLKDLTIIQELELYLKTILNLKDKNIHHILGVYRDTIKEDDLE